MPVVVYKHPLYLREHSKRMLRSALFNDSEHFYRLLLPNLLIVKLSSYPTSMSWTTRWLSESTLRNTSL